MSKEYRHVNLNWHIKVKLTKAGIEAYKKHWEEYGVHDSKVKIDEQGYSKFQLHDLMPNFGDMCYIGNENLPFETNVLIEFEEEEK